jgi:hypothetical protein
VNWALDLCGTLVGGIGHRIGDTAYAQDQGTQAFDGLLGTVGSIRQASARLRVRLETTFSTEGDPGPRTRVQGRPNANVVSGRTLSPGCR